jgi:hypothetical protein
VGRAKGNIAASDSVNLQASLPETSVQQGSQGDVGAALVDDLAVSEASEFVEEYALPSWAEFRTFVMENGNQYVRASYPDAPADLIETIWCGVPVLHHEQARVMTPKGEWVVY